MSEHDAQDDLWFFQALCASFARLEEHDHVLLQELCYTEAGRRDVSWALAGMFLDIGLRPPEEPVETRNAIKEIISQELLAGCLLQLIEERSDAASLREWTVSQSGWYGIAKKSLEGEPNAGKPASGSHVSVVQAAHPRPWRAHQSRRPNRRAPGDEE